MNLTDEDIQLLEELVVLGTNQAHTAVVRGMCSDQPYPSERLIYLSTAGHTRAFEILEQLKETHHER